MTTHIPHSQVTYENTDGYRQIQNRDNQHQDNIEAIGPYSSMLTYFGLELKNDPMANGDCVSQISWAKDFVTCNAHSHQYSKLYTLRNGYYEEGSGKYVHFSIAQTIEDLESRVYLWHDARVANFPVGYEKTFFGRDKKGLMLESEMDKFNNYQVVKSAKSDLELMGIGTTFPKHVQNKLAIILAKRSVVYGNPELMKLEGHCPPRKEIMSLNLLAIYCENSGRMNLLERLLMINDGNIFTEDLHDRGYYQNNNNLISFLLFPRMITSCLVEYLKVMNPSDLQALLELRKKDTNVSTIVFGCLSFVANLTEKSFEELLSKIEQAKVSGYVNDSYKLITLAEICNHDFGNNLLLEKPEMLQTIQSYVSKHSPLQTFFKGVFNEISSEQTIHEPESDVRPNLTQREPDQQILPLNWEPDPANLEVSAENSSHAPSAKFRPSRLKKRLLRYFKLQRANRRALRQMKDLLRRKSYKNSAAEMLHGESQPSAIEQLVEAKYLTKRLVSTFLPFNNVLLDTESDDEGFASVCEQDCGGIERKISISDRDSANNKSEVHTSGLSIPSLSSNLANNVSSVTGVGDLDMSISCVRPASNIEDVNDDCGIIHNNSYSENDYQNDGDSGVKQDETDRLSTDNDFVEHEKFLDALFKAMIEFYER